MDVIFIEDRKEFDSIMRYNNIEYFIDDELCQFSRSSNRC